MKVPRSAAPDLAACLSLFVFAATLIAPLFASEYLANWGSIDSTFIAHARYLTEQWPNPLWQPLWYCGTRFDYVYPPALPYGTAALSLLSGISTARAYHVHTALLYCLGIVAVYVLMRTGAGSRRWAFIAGAAAAVISPAFAFLPAFREDSALQMPQRLNVLLKWGEGPHMSALAVLPFALAASWDALQSGRAGITLVAAALCAAVVAHNFYGATALAYLYAVLVWSVWVTKPGTAVLVRAAVVAGLAYGLSAFWLTPSYVRITLANLKLVAQPGNAWSVWVAVAAAAAFAMWSWWFGRAREERGWPIFVAGAGLLFTGIVAGHHYLGFRLGGEPHRFVPELDLVLILCAAEGLRRLFPHRPGLATGLVVVAFATGYSYLAQPWSVIVRDSGYKHRAEFVLSDWVDRNLPSSRTFATGSLRLWYNAWHDGAQVGGGSDQGILNQMIALAQWQVMKDPTAGRDIAWLQATGADAIVVSEPGSATLYPEYPEPRKFEGVLPRLFDDGNGNVIYGVPRRYRARARIVSAVQAAALKPIQYSNENEAEVRAYARLLEEGPERPVSLRWDSPRQIVVHAEVREGEALVVQESFDPAWRAYSADARVPIRRDAAGFMILAPPTGPGQVMLVFETPLENQIARIVSVACLIGSVAAVWRSRGQVRQKNQPHQG